MTQKSMGDLAANAVKVDAQSATETARHATDSREAGRAENGRQAPESTESGNKESDRQETPWKESGRQETDRQGMDRQEIDRREIDALDARIVQLIRDRHRISSRIQQRRRREGGPRTVLTREMVVIDRYRQGLGPEGTALATAILRLCRGPAPEAPGPVPAGRGEPDA
ncbi:chorismate mutase [Streptomyces sp. NBC_00670]|uniref:chorismate mutase n=1 Tax=Streptomyces sp. NBC_00670 TaxID=2975804 RepID=UPI002E30672A|nr:chorismate mutase [Streptomyces sp. NBC_00670]